MKKLVTDLLSFENFEEGYKVVDYNNQEIIKNNLLRDDEKLILLTMTFPGIGTATGCIGGTVIGGALGFSSGALSGVAANLLITCFRGSTSVSCNRMMKLGLGLSPVCLTQMNLLNFKINFKCC